MAEVHVPFAGWQLMFFEVPGRDIPNHEFEARFQFHYSSRNLPRHGPFDGLRVSCRGCQLRKLGQRFSLFERFCS